MGKKEKPMDRFGMLVPTKMGAKGPKVPKEVKKTKGFAPDESKKAAMTAAPSFAGTDPDLEALQRSLNQNAKTDNAVGVDSCVSMQAELVELEEGVPRELDLGVIATETPLPSRPRTYPRIVRRAVSRRR